MSVQISLMKKNTGMTIERYTVGDSLTIQNIWTPVAERAGLETLSCLGDIMGFDDLVDILALRDEFVELKRFIVEDTPPEFEEHNYPPQVILEDIEHIIAMLEKAIADSSLRVHSS